MRHAGFTLLEMSIVFVIIGLMIGGIVVGRDMIKAAEIRKEVSNLTSYQVAVQTFELKYNAVPGDFNQTGVIPGLADDHLGDGDGMLTVGDLAIGSNAWEHLSKAGLIQGDYDNAPNFLGGAADAECPANISCPPTPFNATSAHLMWGFYDISGSNTNAYGSPLAATNANIAIAIFNGTGFANWTGGGLTVDQAYALDVKLDDGVANAGRVMAIDANGGSSGCVDGNPADNPLDFTTYSYNYFFRDTADDCWLYYVLQ
jgi:prepilin-type N-terminal cleavage/methylation domain-containing protein